MGTVSRRRSRSFFPRVSSRIPRLPGGEGRENDLRVKLAGFMTRDKRGRRGGGGGGRKLELYRATLPLSIILFSPNALLFLPPPPLHSYTYTFESASPRSKTTPVLSILRFITRRKAKVSGTRWNVRFVNWNGTFLRERKRESEKKKRIRRRREKNSRFEKSSMV